MKRDDCVGKQCVHCGKSAGIFGKTKLKDGYLCKKCSKEFAEAFKTSNKSVDTITYSELVELKNDCKTKNTKHLMIMGACFVVLMLFYSVLSMFEKPNKNTDVPITTTEESTQTTEITETTTESTTETTTITTTTETTTVITTTTTTTEETTVATTQNSASVQVPVTSSQSTDYDVYVTPTGKKYHSYSGCRGLSNAKSVSTVKASVAAKRGLEPCNFCC
jgi:uncharacterized membrane protein YvbJ